MSKDCDVVRGGTELAGLSHREPKVVSFPRDRKPRERRKIFIRLVLFGSGE